MENVIPTVGMGATKVVGSDRYPYTVTQILSPTRIIVSSDTYTRVDKNGLSEIQQYEYASNFNDEGTIITKRKNGRWYKKGESSKGSSYVVGVRRAYQDPSF